METIGAAGAPVGDTLLIPAVSDDSAYLSCSHYIAAQQAISKGELALAMQELIRTIKLYPYHLQPFLLLSATARAAGELSVAFATLRVAVTSAPGENADIQVEFARCFEAADQPEQALEHYRSALRLSPFDRAIHRRVIELLLYLGRAEEALHALHAALSVLQDDPGFWSATSLLNFGRGHAEAALLQLTKARSFGGVRLALFREAVSLAENFYPDHPEVLLSRGLVEENGNQWWKALALYQRAAARLPTWEEPWNRIAGTAYLCGEPDLALQAHKTAFLIRKEQRPKAQQLRILTDFCTAMGHLALIEVYRKLELLNLLPTAQTVILPPAQVPNSVYLDYFSQFYPIIRDSKERKFYEALLPLQEQGLSVFELVDGRVWHLYEMICATQAAWEDQGGSHLLTLHREHEEMGRDFLRRCGVPEESWFVGLHVRDTGFEEGAWKHQHRAGRCAHIHTYLPAIDEITKRGGWVVRLGDPGMVPLPRLPQVIDMTLTPSPGPWFDVFVWAKSKFFIATPSGPSECPPTFGVPVIHTNYASVSTLPRTSGDLVIPKLVRARGSSQPLPLGEHLRRPELRFFENLELFRKLDVELLDNEPDDIRLAVLEMLDRVEGRAHYSQDDIEAQQRFRKSIRSNEYTGRAQPARVFLQKYRALLD
jgi:putative glycosyltransferase (TIGR04372 family)